MNCRYDFLKASITGYDHSGVPLVAEITDEYLTRGYSDNVGIYYVIPWIVRTFGVSLDRAIDLFLYGVLYTGFVCAAVGLLVLFRTTTQRAIALAQLGLLFWFTIHRIVDVYVIGVSVTVALLPWALWLLRRDSRHGLTAAFCALAGVCVGASHFFRVHAATGVAVFILIYLLFDAGRSRLSRATLALALLAGVAGPVLWFGHLIHQRDAYLEASNPEAYARSKSAFGACTPWQSIYIGFGYLNNQHGIRYDDYCAIERVSAEAPDAVYLASEYQNILRSEVLGLVKRDREFVVTTIAAKTGVLTAWFARFATFGLLTVWLLPISLRLNCAFLGAGLFAALPGILVMPYPHYVSGLLAVATIYGTVTLNHFADRFSFRSIFPQRHNSGGDPSQRNPQPALGRAA
jgi:hypothetical protein